MNKVDKLEVVVDVSEVMNVYGGYDIDFMNDFYKGDGIYCMEIGSRGEIDEIYLSDEYMSKEEMIEEFEIFVDGDSNKWKMIEEYKEELDEFYSVEYKDEGYGRDILEVGYSSENYCVYFKVEEKQRMYIMIDLYSGESKEVELDEQLQQHLNSTECAEGAVNTWLDEEYMIVQIQ